MKETKKRLLIETLETWIKLIKDDKCTVDTIDSIADNVAEIVTDVEIKDVAKDFNKSSKDIHNAINRNRYGNKLRPKRKVFYNLSELLKIIPVKWLDKK